MSISWKKTEWGVDRQRPHRWYWQAFLCWICSSLRWSSESLDGGLWHYPHIEMLCWIFIMGQHANKTKGTLLHELQPKCDTSWMGYWTGKILTYQDNKFCFGIYCLFQRMSWRNVSRYSILKNFVCFHLCKEYVVVHYPLLDEMSWLEMGIADWIWSVVGHQNILTKSNFSAI